MVPWWFRGVCWHSSVARGTVALAHVAPGSWQGTVCATLSCSAAAGGLGERGGSGCVVCVVCVEKSKDQLRIWY